MSLKQRASKTEGVTHSKYCTKVSTSWAWQKKRWDWNDHLYLARLEIESMPNTITLRSAPHLEI